MISPAPKPTPSFSTASSPSESNEILLLAFSKSTSYIISSILQDLHWLPVNISNSNSFCSPSRSSTTWPLHICPISSLSPRLQPAPSDPPALSTSLCPLPAPAPWELSFQPLCHSPASTITNTDSLLFKSTFKMPPICPFNSFIFVFYCLTLFSVLECPVKELINKKHY